MIRSKLEKLELLQEELEDSVKNVLERYLKVISDLDDPSYIGGIDCTINDIYTGSETYSDDNISFCKVLKDFVVIEVLYYDTDWDGNIIPVVKDLHMPVEWLYDEDYRLQAEEVKLSRIASYEAQQKTVEDNEKEIRRLEYLKLKEEFGND